MNQNKLNNLTLMGLFSALIFILAFTPFGFIQLPFIKATIIHIPVIIGSILIGPKYGSVLGFLFGLTSLINNTMAPTMSSFAFSPLIPMPVTGRGSLLSLIVCFVPRILVGVFPWIVYNGLKRLCSKKFETACYAVSGIIGSLTNTLLVMSLIFIFFRDSYAISKNVALGAVYKVILSIIVVNGIPEALVAGLFTAAVCTVIDKVKKN